MEQNSRNNAIELQGIVRNSTKLAQQDGQTEELINLRLKDGSWQPTGEGKQVFSLPDGWTFNQMYIHTNVYRHLLGVSNNTLYWIANIDPDGVFYVGDTAEPTNDYHNEAVGLFQSGGSYQPVELCKTKGEVNIMQTGHLITIIDESERFDYFVFKRDDYAGTQEYKKVIVDVNDEPTNRELFPFGKIYFDLYNGNPQEEELEIELPATQLYGEADPDTVVQLEKDHHQRIIHTDSKFGLYTWSTFHDDELDFNYQDSDVDDLRDIVKAGYIDMIDKFTEKNRFTNPFLICAAIKLYDGSYVLASNPVLLYPREITSNNAETTSLYDYSGNLRNIKHPRFIYGQGFGQTKETDMFRWSNKKSKYCKLVPLAFDGDADDDGINDFDFKRLTFFVENNINKDYVAELTTPFNDFPTFSNGFTFQTITPLYNNIYKDPGIGNSSTPFMPYFIMDGFASDIFINIKDKKFIYENSDIFTSLCLFITNPATPYNIDKDMIFKLSAFNKNNTTNKNWQIMCAYYDFDRRTQEQIVEDLIHSPFYLLREYNKNELVSLQHIVNLQDAKFDGLLKNITQQPTLSTESLSRATYIPKVTYNYNGRLHIANYTSFQYLGYPLDEFLFHNLTLRENSNSDFFIFNGVENGDDTRNQQYPRQSYPFIEDIQYLSGNAAQTINLMQQYDKPFAYIKTTIETDTGTQIMVRYIPAYNPTITEKGRIDVIQSLNPFVCFPDSRAKEMEIYVVNVQQTGICKIYKKTLQLEAHPYLNLAYYMSPDLRPIDLDYIGEEQDIELLDDVPQEVNPSEYYPNGLKVSKTNNPMFFPYESTYQVGSSEIMALMSNTKAVGTGQTGQAPLYVFSKDGVYGLFVDSSGEVAYHTARILTRDVCNNAQSVTPTDEGVAFTTDRGLMLMQGEQALELSQPAEGEPNKYYDTTNSVEYCKIAANALRLNQLAGLAGSETQEDLLEFLKGSIINYNHNERELMVSNPDKQYTYILDRNGNWQKRSYTADEYVNNFPTSYRVKDGVFYKVDEESNADNGVYILTRPVKLGTIAYKQAFRCVVRGVFETLDNTHLGLYVFGSYDGRKWALLGRKEKKGGQFADIGCLVERTDFKFLRLCLAGQLKQESRIDFIEITAETKLHDKLR